MIALRGDVQSLGFFMRNMEARARTAALVMRTLRTIMAWRELKNKF